MGYRTYQEMIEYRKSLSSVLSNEELLRQKYTKALKIVLRYLYDTGTIYDHEKFIDRQSDVIKEPIALNNTYYENKDLLALKSMGITNRDKQIQELNKLDKYTEEINWDEKEPNLVYIEGDSMTDEFSGEKYKFVLELRKAKFKRIQSKLYDKVIYSIYKFNEDINDYDKVAIGSFYYHSASKYQYRYMNLYDYDGTLIPDIDNSTEYSLDVSTKTRE